MHKVTANITVKEMLTLSGLALSTFHDATAFAKDEMFGSVFGEIDTLDKKLEKTFASVKVSLSLEKADEARDEAIRNLYAILQGYAAMPNEEKKAAAHKILAALAPYGLKIVTESYAMESASIRGLLNVLDADTLKADIALLDGVSDVIEALRAAEQELLEAGKTSIKASNEKNDSSYKVKKQLLDVFNSKLVPYLSGCAAIKPEKYATFAADIGKLIDRANDSVSARTK